MSPSSEASPSVKASWAEYDYKVRSELRAPRGKTKSKGNFTPFVNRELELQTSLDALERSKEFHAFVEAVRTAVIADEYHMGGISFWEQAVRNALRRSGYYYGFFAGRVASSQTVLKRVLRAFEPHDINITYLAPMEYVCMEVPQIACRNFSIRKFTQAELDDLLKTEICGLFYPRAVINTGFLCSYWFIVVKEKRSLRPIGKIGGDFGSIGKVTLQYSPYPALEKVLNSLVMYNWLPDWANYERRGKGKKRTEWKGWLGFKIPFVIRITDNILDSPRPAPNLEQLETEPYFDPHTNEELGEKPSWYINLDKEQTRALERCITTVDTMLGKVESLGPSSSFLRRGQGFLVKGFFTKGLEQLLWHMTALETLFGENRPGLTQLIAQRVALVLGETKDQRTAIKRQFTELYELRSNLVHGSELKIEIWQGHLKDARDLARCSLLWFLSFMVEISKAARHSSIAMLPERKELLAVLDSRSEAIVGLARILQSVPPSFPAVDAWQEPWNLSP